MSYRRELLNLCWILCSISHINGLESLKPNQLPANEQRQRYYVKTPTCHMPYINPFTPDVMKIFKLQQFEDCRNDSDLITSEYDFERKQYRLHINRQLAETHLNVSEHMTLECSYQKVQRATENKAPDQVYKQSQAQLLSENYYVPKDTDFLTTKCYLRNGSQELRMLQRDAFQFVQDRLHSEELHQYAQNMQSYPSVIILGLDSVSRINLRRTMPQVFNYMRGTGWYEMQGYNKVGENTFPNLMAVLTGYSAAGAASNICNATLVRCLDKYPFIWKAFKKFNYATAFGEDCVNVNTFNYLRPGFVQQPTDYYIRHFLLALERQFKLRKRFGNNYCVGRRLSFSYVYDFALQFVQRFLYESPMFGFFWSNSFTHDSYDAPSALDALYSSYLQKFEQAGLFQRAIVIVMSDHGHRFNALRRAPNGFYEERLPMLFIHLPRWFRLRHKHLVKNLRKNRNRLSSPYDLHMTLQHLLQLEAELPTNVQPQSPQCASCQSLFFELPLERSCAAAGIADHWCTCTPTVTITHKSYAKDIVAAVLQHMNEFLVVKNLNQLCTNFTLKHLIKLDRKKYLSPNYMLQHKNESVYLVNFVTNPSSVQYETSVIYNNATAAIQMDVEQISRLSKYKMDSWCMWSSNSIKYCSCKSEAQRKLEASLENKKLYYFM